VNVLLQMFSVAPGARLPRRGEVALTFDDGPHAQVTDDVLRVLRRKQVRATFFMVGQNVARRGSVARRVVSAGHRAQIHGYTHHDLRRMSTAEIQRELSRTRSAIADATGQRPTAFRPPYGYTNSKVRSAASALGLSQVLWNAVLEVRTSSSTRGLSEIRAQVAKARSNRVGATVLLHDGSGRTDVMLRVLPALIDELRADGWTFVTIR
jgi:peptidoglycan/xylan/chitin deacetylase (PgdA/CDA1 family)